ncbi:MAG: MFS transporter [Cellulomonadaceae bacterium]|jgi:MFS family permease|nr:MFS transporter [Cellulomonadaceae bacterium]
MGVLQELRALLRLPGFRQLFLVRVVSQAGDGAFQVGLATVLFFSPETAGTAAQIAGGFAIMFAPFVIAPFVGVLLDRWQRRGILLWANVVRAAVTLAAAAVMLMASGTWVVAGLGLVALSLNRFILSGLSAGMPLVLVDHPSVEPRGDSSRVETTATSVERADGFDTDLRPGSTDGHRGSSAGDLLLTANSVVPTLGAGATFLGGGIGFALGFLLPQGRTRDAVALVVASLLMAAAAACALRLSPGQLGPEHPATTRIFDDVAVILTDLRDAARYLVARKTPAQGLMVMAAHRFLYGIVFIAAILISRNLLSPGDVTAGIATFATIIGLIGVGGGLAVVLTPVISRNTGPQVWVGLMLILAAFSQGVMAVSHARLVIMVCALLLGLAAQAAKIAVDTIVARDTEDDYRGRAFAFYDLLFNAAFTAAAGLAAVIVPDMGWSRPLFLGLAAAYGLIAVMVLTRAARTPQPTML